jgi:hypothetical protein
MRVIWNAPLAILIISLASVGPSVTAPAKAAEMYMWGEHKALPKRSLNYPYGGTYVDISHAKRSFSYPYVGFYYGNYYGDPYGGYDRYRERLTPCFRPVRGCK